MDVSLDLWKAKVDGEMSDKRTERVYSFEDWDWDWNDKTQDKERGKKMMRIE